MGECPAGQLLLGSLLLLVFGRLSEEGRESRLIGSFRGALAPHRYSFVRRAAGASILSAATDGVFLDEVGLLGSRHSDPLHLLP